MGTARSRPLLALGVVMALALLSGALAVLLRAAQPEPGATATSAVAAVPVGDAARTAVAVQPGGPAATQPAASPSASSANPAAVAPHGSAATAQPSGPAEARPPAYRVVAVVAAPPAKPVLCVRTASVTLNSQEFIPVPASTLPNPCDTYVAECPPGSYPSGTFNVCTKNCEFGKPVPVNDDCPPEPTKPCQFGPPVPVSQNCPPEPTKPCQFGPPVPVSQNCPPEPTKPCQFGPPVPVGQNCPPEPTKTCPDGVVTGLGKPCPQQAVTCPNGVVVTTGETCPDETVRCPGGQVVPTGGSCPAPMAVCPGGISMPAGASCPSPCPPQANPSGSGCEPVETPPSATAPVMPAPDPGELLLDKATVTGAEPLFARGAGCEPGTKVVLTTTGPDGLVEVVGRAVADSEGRFKAAVQFASLRAGYREVTANCGTSLVSGVDMVLTSSTGGTSMTYVLLVFFLLAGFLVVRFQMGEARRGRRR